MAATERIHVAVIGAGISGVVTAAHLKREGLEVTVFERSKSAGGIWVYDECRPLEPAYPSVLASEGEGYYQKDSSRGRPFSGEETEQLRHSPPGPCYVGLKNNVSTRLLQTTLNPFPQGTPDFVSHDVLRDYIQDTANVTGVHAYTRYNTEVKSVQKIDSKWRLEATTLSATSTGHTTSIPIVQNFDSIIVASGHYHAPRIPDIPGLASWKRQWPSRVQHSKGYRKPEDFKGKNFLLIGGSVSATDIARELGPYAEKIYQSHRNGAFDLPASLLPDNAVRVDEVVAFEETSSTATTPTLAEQDAIPATITLKSGGKLCDIHHIILCTGYHITLPFLRQYHSDATLPAKAGDELLVTDGNQLHNLHKDIFYFPDPSLVFVGVPYFTATFTLFEFQAMVVAKVLSGQATLPTTADMRAEYNKRVQAKGYGKAFHSLREREVEYVNDLLAWINSDLQKLGRPSLEGHTQQWHLAREDQVARMKAMFAGGSDMERKYEVTCR